MKLYHGSDKDVRKPIFGEGNPSNDYGLGFYLTDIKEIGKLWACKNENDGYLMSYNLDLSDLNILYLDHSNEEDVFKWLTILVKNRFDKESKIKNKDTIDWLIRHFDIDLDGYDVIVGYRADDSYFSYSKDFVENNLSFEVLTKAMKLGKLGIQYALISKKAFNTIKYIKTIIIKKSDEYDIFRDKTLREYHRLKNTDSNNNTFIRDLIRKYGN